METQVLKGELLDIYISGYTDGEGCFCISFQPNKRCSLGWEVRPSFSVSQNGDRAEVLNIMMEKFGCGSIRPDPSDQTVKYEVRSITELMERVIPHFQRNPLLSSKRQDFLLFVEGCRVIAKGDHLTKEGFMRIVDIAIAMNPSGKRKYSRSEILSSLAAR